ncbi:nuclear transport factor 2 family protein [Agrococcus lahaulensis]|uniref:nuclear transport factor 2 family protein n=1 Tax=Agrococcus lahaulensis TaxID=341722 RepID=UPI00047E35FF|nr:nuclear transport factor 2 family protein [Agrococcus lahaulensis]
MSVLDELLELERAGWRSLCESTGDGFYGRLMTDDGLMVLVDGSVLDRAAVVASLGHAPPWASFEIREPRVVAVGAESAALVYTGVARREGMELVARMSSAYVRVDGEWRLALYQQTLAGPVEG